MPLSMGGIVLAAGGLIQFALHVHDGDVLTLPTVATVSGLLVRRTAHQSRG